MVAVTLLHRQGYFYQRLDAHGWQQEEPAAWAVNDFVHAMPARASVTIERRTGAPPRLALSRAWRWRLHRAGIFFGY